MHLHVTYSTNKLSIAHGAHARALFRVPGCYKQLEKCATASPALAPTIPPNCSEAASRRDVATGPTPSPPLGSVKHAART